MRRLCAFWGGSARVLQFARDGVEASPAQFALTFPACSGHAVDLRSGFFLWRVAFSAVPYNLSPITFFLKTRSGNVQAQKTHAFPDPIRTWP
jgi:hypothetical protein